jgi:formate hydrogenlyase subunit 4
MRISKPVSRESRIINSGEAMYEAYAAMLVGTVCGAAAVLALQISRNLSAIAYTAVHLGTILLMIVLVTFGYDSIPFAERHPQLGISRLLYVAVSWTFFIATMLIHRQIQGAYASSPKVVKS